MKTARVAPLVGILGCVGVVASLLYPYAVGTTGVSTYYGTGAVSPWAAALLALVTAIAFAAGRAERSDPVTMAGATIVFGLAIVFVGLAWGLTVRIDAVLLTPAHRWVVAVGGLVVTAAGGWYARGLGVL